MFAVRNDRVLRSITPRSTRCDLAAFAYIMPIVILFSVGGGRGHLHQIYAIPPAVRIPALGIEASSRRRRGLTLPGRNGASDTS